MGASTAAFAGSTNAECVPRGRHLRRAPSRGMVPGTVVIVPAGETRQIRWSAVSAVGPRRPLTACLRASGQSSARRSQWTSRASIRRQRPDACFRPGKAGVRGCRTRAHVARPRRACGVTGRDACFRTGAGASDPESRVTGAPAQRPPRVLQPGEPAVTYRRRGVGFPLRRMRSPISPNRSVSGVRA